jgi:hypothetical protein
LFPRKLNARAAVVFTQRRSGRKNVPEKPSNGRFRLFLFRGKVREKFWFVRETSPRRRRGGSTAMPMERDQNESDDSDKTNNEKRTHASMAFYRLDSHDRIL